MEQSHNNGRKVKLLCSYGGKIKSRPTDHQLSYVGGDTKIVAVDRAVKFSEIVAKLNSVLSYKNDGGGEISVKYQLPGEDLDSLVSLIDDDDVEHMMIEYDRMQRISAKPARLRIFIFNISAPPVKPLPASNPDYLFGFDKEYQPSIAPPPTPTPDLFQIPPRFNIAPVQAVYRLPVVVNEGAYSYSNGVGNANGNREQSVYNIIPMMPPVSMGNSVEMNGNRRHF